MAFKKRGRKLVPKVYFTLTSGKYIQVLVEGPEEAEAMLGHWDAAQPVKLQDHPTYFHPNEQTRIRVSDVVAVAYVGPEEDEE